jgi:two-component system sensor kinase FixL
MSWVTIIWSIVASACLSLAALHLLVWCQKRAALANLFFSLAAAATAVLAMCELWMMWAQTPAQFGTALRWLHVPVWVIVVAMVGFIRLYLRAGRPWLAWTICILRTFSLLLNFLVGQNLNYREVTGLRHIPFFGESVSVAEGVSNPWMIVGQLSLVLFVVFTVDAAITVWRRGNRRQALIMGGSIVFCSLAGTIQSLLIFWGIVHWPITASLCFTAFIAAMSYEMSRDILNTAQLSEELRKSEERMALAAGAARLRYWEWDIVRDELWAAEQTRTHPGGPAQSGRKGFNEFLQSLHPDDREPVSHAVAKSMNGDDEYECEYRVLLPKGATNWMVSRGRVEFNGAGKPLRMRGVSIDITERKRGEEALRESEARFRAIADAAPVMIWMSGTDKLCNFFNRGWLDFTGRRLEQELGNGWAEGVHPDDLAGCLKNYTESFDARRPFILEYRLRRHDGEYRWISDNGVPRYDSGRNFLGYIGSCVDLTARKQAEAEALRQRAELTHVTRVSTMGALASSLAHELNQPLSAILSNAQAASRFLAAATPDLTEVRGALEDIAQDTKRAGEVIRQVRALVRRDEPDLVPLELNRVISDVVRLLHSDMLIRKVRIALELDPALHRTSGDSAQLQQVILNLVLNAFDSMMDVPEGRRTAILRTRQLDADTIRVEVSDQGTGISPEKLVNLFEPFRSSKREGLGLGLTISHSIIETHKGRLWAENNPDQGATFYFTLPVHQAELDLH